MPPDHNQPHSRRPHYHRGRRGPDRRGGERRPQQSQQQTESAARDQLDIEQIMREIRSRISERHGIDLTTQQIQELAARRLEAILDPRTIKPSLMDELRRASGLPADTVPSEPEGGETINESALYQTDSGFLRALRRLFNPLLKLLFNPAAIVDALNAQTRRAREAATREAELRRRQTEWNALHFEILRRLVTDISRVEVDNQHLAHRVESLMARVDFNERRVRGLEQTQHQAQQSRPSGRPVEVPAISTVAAPQPLREDSPSSDHVSSDASPDGSRRRRRRRRGRRSGQPREFGPGGAPVPGMAAAATVEQVAEGDEFGDDDTASDDLTDDVTATSEPADQSASSPSFDSPSSSFDSASPSFDPASPSFDSTSPSFEAPSPAPEESSPTFQEEPVRVVSSTVEHEPDATQSSPVSPSESAERRDRLPPEQS